MDVLGWLVWLLLKAMGLVWSFAWFLLGGWLSALAQVAVVVGIVFAYKYGWQRAPFEVWARARAFGRFLWAWMRSKEPGAWGSPAPAAEVREVVRVVRVKERGDVNASSLLSALLLLGMLGWALM